MSAPVYDNERLAGISQRYRHLLSEVDAWFESCLEVGGDELACRSGCSSCCKALFDITLLDAWLLREEFERLPRPVQEQVQARCVPRLVELQSLWPRLKSPLLLNAIPEQEWLEMPEDDQEPCPLLDKHGKCLVYASRPLICRLHGLPHLDVSGEDFSAVVCSLHHTAPEQVLPEDLLRWHFRRAFAEEVSLSREFVGVLTAGRYRELDTFIPLALLEDYQTVDWRELTL